MDNDLNHHPNNQINSIAYITFKHIDAILEAAVVLRDRLLIWLLSRTGCRISEVLAIALDDIDFSLKTITIKHLKRSLKLVCSKCQTRVRRGNVFCPNCGKKIDSTIKEKLERRQRRLIPIDDDSIAMIRKHIDSGRLANRGRQLMLFGINRHRAWQIIRRCGIDAGIPRLINPETGKMHNIGPHCFRVAFTVHWIKTDDSPESLKALQEHLGHQNFTTTMRYRKISLEERRKYYDRIKWSVPHSLLDWNQSLPPD